MLLFFYLLVFSANLSMLIKKNLVSVNHAPIKVVPKIVSMTWNLQNVRYIMVVNINCFSSNCKLNISVKQYCKKFALEMSPEKPLFYNRCKSVTYIPFKKNNEYLNYEPTLKYSQNLPTEFHCFIYDFYGKINIFNILTLTLQFFGSIFIKASSYIWVLYFLVS